MATNTYVALDKKTVTSAVASVEFTGISSGYTDLVLVVSVYGTSNDVGLYAQFNSDTTSSYSDTLMIGTGSAAQSARYTNGTYAHILGYNSGISSTSGVFCPAIINLQNYSNTTTNKTILTRGFAQNNSGNGDVYAITSLWRKTEAISSIKLFLSSGNIAVGSTFSLYGIAAASVGAKATGGTIYSDSQYYYHVFGSTGTFTPLQSLTCDYLVIAGGGGGGGQANDNTSGGGGGGAGGLRSTVGATGGGGSLETPLSLSATAYTVTVGAGGAGGTSDRGTNGTNSTLSTVTSIGGGAGGGKTNTLGNSGGSGGGSAYPNTSTPAAGTTNQGYSGGANNGSNGNGGGGGGAGQAGQTNPSNAGGYGGSGVAITGFATATGTGVSNYYAGGGGGGAYAAAGQTGGAGGAGGGGTGATAVGGVGTAGVVNTGSGGGGTSETRTGGAGGSGIVIVRYAK